MRQKGECHNGGNNKIKQAKYSEKQTLLIPGCAHKRVRTYQGVRNVRFLEIWRASFSCYLYFEIDPFALLLTKRSFYSLCLH